MKDMVLYATAAKDIASTAKGGKKAVKEQPRPRCLKPGKMSYCGDWVLPKTTKVKKEQVKGPRKVSEEATRRQIAAKFKAAAEKDKAPKASPRTPPRKAASTKAATTPSKNSRPRASPSPSRSSQRQSEETAMEVDPTFELVQEIQDWKQAIAWEKFGVPGPIFHGLIAKGENCPLQHMLEEVNGAQVKCTCAMCIDCAGGNYPDEHRIPEGLPGQPFVKVEEGRCKLFAYLAAKAAQFELPPLAKLPTAASSTTLVARLSKEAEPLAAEPWLRQVWRLPYAKQVDFFRLVHSICVEVMPEETGPFQHWFRFYGKSLLPVGAGVGAGAAAAAGGA